MCKHFANVGAMKNRPLGSYIFLFLTLIGLNGFLAFAQATTLINIALEDVDVSLDERAKLQNSLTAFFNDDISVISDNYITTNIQLTTGENTTSQWYRSRYQLPSLPGFAYFSLPNPSPGTEITAVLKRPYTILTNSVAYPVNDISAALTMLSGQRVNGIIDYSANVALYFMENDELEYEIIREATPLFIEFSSMTELDVFEQLVMAAEQEGRSIPFPSKQTVETRSAKTQVDFYVLNKLFDNGTKKLLPLTEEVSAMQWWDDSLPEYNLTLRYASSSEAFAAMSEAENICIMNIFKDAEREKLAYFSKPALFYLNARLYALASSEAAQTLKKSLNGMPVNLIEWLPQQKDTIFGYSNVVLRLLGDIAMSTNANKQRYINLDELPIERVVGLLQRNRVDFVIDYPTRLKQARDKVGDTSPLISFEIENATESSAAYIACNRSPIGSTLISSINSVLADPTKIETLIEIYTQGYSASDVEKYREDALQPH